MGLSEDGKKPVGLSFAQDSLGAIHPLPFQKPKGTPSASARGGRSRIAVEHPVANARRTFGFALFVLTSCWIQAARSGVGQSDGEPSQVLLPIIPPRQAILVCYCPNLERLFETCDTLTPLSDSDDALLGPATARLQRLDKELLQVWAKRLGVTKNDVTGALPGGILVGWMPGDSPNAAAFERDNWVLLARRSPEREQAIRELWRRVVANKANEARLEHLQIGGVAVEQVVWEESSEAELTARGRLRTPQSDLEGVAPKTGQKPGSFSQVTKVRHRALSLGLSEEFVFFTPSRADRLGPWIRAAGERQTTTEQSNRPFAWIGNASSAGELILAIQAVPPAWVPPVETALERYLGPHPEHVLFSQARSLEAVVTGRGDQIVLEAKARLLPPPGWLARIVGTLSEGAAFSAAPDAVAELCVCADFERLWPTFHAVLTEGWPAVAVALDTFLAPLGGEQGEGMAPLAAALDREVAMFSFPAAEGDDMTGSWAIAVQLRDRERFAFFEPRLERLLQTFSFVTARYEVMADGRLEIRGESAATTAPMRLPRVHVAQWGLHFLVAGSPNALEKAIVAVSGGQVASQVAVGSKLLSAVLPYAWSERRPSIVASVEILPHSPGGRLFDKQMRRTIRTPGGIIVLDSPPRELRTSVPSHLPSVKSPETAAPKPVARLTGALVVEPESSVRVMIGLQRPDWQGGDFRRPRPGRPKEPTIQE